MRYTGPWKQRRLFAMFTDRNWSMELKWFLSEISSAYSSNPGGNRILISQNPVSGPLTRRAHFLSLSKNGSAESSACSHSLSTGIFFLRTKTRSFTLLFPALLPGRGRQLHQHGADDVPEAAHGLGAAEFHLPLPSVSRLVRRVIGKLWQSAPVPRVKWWGDVPRQQPVHQSAVWRLRGECCLHWPSCTKGRGSRDLRLAPRPISHMERMSHMKCC